MTPDNRVLLVKGRQTGKWSFPKGHLEPYESSLECALRELYEETGVELNGQPHIGYNKLSVGRYFFFAMDSDVPTRIKDTTEVTEADWIPISELTSLECNVDVNAFVDRLGR
jgi:8-oxo-dGTP pyrophosphatase MutT (NUDIX family)